MAARPAAVSVVVVSHRPTELLARCLESVQAQAGEVDGVEVVVVDNGSPGEEASRVARRRGAVAVRLGENLGFPAGVNAGCRQATGDLVALLNDDAVAGTGWLRSAASVLEDPSVAAVAPKVVLGGRFLEVLVDDGPWLAPGDPRPLGRRLWTATVGARDVLGSLAGPGVHRLETGPVAGDDGPGSGSSGRGGGAPPERWRWTAGRQPFYVPLLTGDEPDDLRLNGEPVPGGRVVTLVNSLGSYLRPDGYAGDIGADLPDVPDVPDVPDTAAGGREPGAVGGAASPVERFALSGAALVTTRRVLGSVGSFVPRYFAYYEDVDWCWRARLCGYRVVSDPSATVRHERGATSGGLESPRVRFLLERNRLLTLLRNAPVGMAARETWRKRRGGGHDGVAEAIPGLLPRALAERAVLSRSWELGPGEVVRRWAGVDVPPDREEPLR